MKTLLAYLLSISSAMAGTCDFEQPTLQKADSAFFEYSPIVIYAWVEPKYENFYRIKIKDVLKGEVKEKEILGTLLEKRNEDTIVTTSGVRFYPKHAGDALLYAKPVSIDGKQALLVFGCLSRHTDLDGFDVPYFNPEKKKELKQAQNWTMEWISILKEQKD